MKKCLSALLITACLITLTGCGAKTKLPAEQPLADNRIHLYQVTDGEVVKIAEDYQLRTPDSVTACVEDTMSMLIAQTDGQMEAYTYMMGEENSLTLDVTLKGNEYTKEDILLLMAAVTETMFQLDDITSISFSVKNNDGDMLDSQLYLRDSFYFYGYEDAGLTERNVCVYEPTDTRDALQKKIVKEHTSQQVSDQELIVRELCQIGVLPKNTKVNQVSVHKGVCYLDLSEEFLENVLNLSAEQVVYSLVDSVIDQTGVDSVQLLVDGKTQKLYRGIVDISGPLVMNQNVIATEN